MATGTFSLPDIYLAAERAKGSKQTRQINDVQIGQMQAHAQMQDIVNLGRFSEQLLQSPDPVGFYNQSLPQLRGAVTSPEILERLNPTNDANEIVSEARQMMQLAQSFAQPQEQPETFRTLSAEEAARFGLEGTGYQINEWTKKISKIGGTGPTVNVNAGEGANNKVIGEAEGQEFVRLQNEAREAATNNQSLDAIDFQLDRVSAVGAGAESIQSVKRLAKTLGVDLEQFGVTDDTGPADAAAALSNAMALRFRSPESGFGMPGALSERDLVFLKSLAPGITQTKEGRKLLIRIMKKMNDRKIELAKMSRQYRAQNEGRFDYAFYDQASQFNQENPIFGEEEVRLAETLSAQQPPQSGTQNGGEPQPGTVEDGWRFKGGDPSDQSNWERVRG